MKPEEFTRMFDTRTGIREARQDLSATETGRRLFESNARQKLRDVLREGNIKKEFTGNDMFKVLNNQKNAEIFYELIGEEATNAARDAAEEIGKRQMRIEGIKGAAKKAAASKFLRIVYPLLP